MVVRLTSIVWVLLDRNCLTLISIRELFNKKYFINFSIILLTFSSKDFVKLLSFDHEMSKLLNKLFVDTIPSMLNCPYWRERPTCAQVLDTRKEWRSEEHTS